MTQKYTPKFLLVRSILRILLVTTAVALSIVTWGPAYTKNTTLLLVAVAICYSTAVPLIANAVQIFNNTRSRKYHITTSTGGWYTLRGSKEDLHKFLQENPKTNAIEISELSH